MNNITTFQPYMNAASGSTDWLGTDDGSRALPANYPDAAAYNAATPADKVRFSQSLPNDWAITENGSAAPNLGFQITSGLVTKASKKVQFGSTLALSYSNQNRIQDAERNRFDLQRQLYAYQTVPQQRALGCLANSASKSTTTRIHFPGVLYHQHLQRKQS